MPSCSVKWCSNHTSTCSLKSKNGVSFHRFPKDKATCQKWVEAVRLERRDPWWTSSNASRICSVHFKESDISSTPCKVNILAKTAVPICTMVWYDNNENNIPPKTAIERTVNAILRTYERKKSNMNVLKESKVNFSYNWNKKGTTMSNINTTVISNVTQDSVPQATKLIKTLEVYKTPNLKEGQEPISDANIDLKTSDNVNVNVPQNKTVPTELYKQEYNKSCKEQCCKSKILVKLNDNTSLILDEDLGNDKDTNFKESNKVCNNSNLRTCGNSKKVSLKELKKYENKEPNQEVANMSNSDMLVKIITNGNAELDANISKSYVGKMLSTYLPKRKDKIIENNIRETCKHIQKNNGLNTVKYKEVNNITVNKCVKDNFNKKLNTGICIKTNIIPNLQPKKNSQEKHHLRVFKNVKKYTFNRSNFFKIPRIREQNKQTVGAEPNKDDNTESNITHIYDLISNQSRIDNIKETDTSVYDEIISELFEASKNVENVSDMPSNGNYQESNKSMCIESNTILCADNNMDTALDKGTNNMHVILDLDTNIYRELNKLMDLKLSSEIYTGLNYEINREVNTDIMATNENLLQFNENKATELNQQMSIMNKNMPTEHSDNLIPESHYYLHTEINGNIRTQCNENMCYNENITTNSIIISNNELQNIEKSLVSNIVTETKKDEFTELKRHLSMEPKLDSMSELCANTLTDIHKNLLSKYENIMTTASTKENIQVPDRDHNAKLVKNTDIEVNDMVTSLQNNVNTDTSKATDANVTNSKQLNSILLEEFIRILSPVSNNGESINLESDINIECKKIRGKDMPDLNTVMNVELCCEENIGFNDEINKDQPGINANFTQYNENTVTELIQQPSIMNRNMPMEHNSHSITESHYYLHTKMNRDIITQGNKNICCNENITNNALPLSYNEMQNLDTSGVNNIFTETRKDEFTEIKKHLSTKPNLDSVAELCTNTLADNDKDLFSKYDSTMPTAVTKENIQVPDRGRHNAEFNKNTNIDENDMDTSLQNNINTDTTTEIKSNVTSCKQFNSILLEELMPNISPDSNNAGNKNFINNSKTDPNTTRPTLNNKMISDINIDCKKIVEKDMLELNTVILSKLNEDQVLKSKEVINRKFHHLNTTDKDILLRKSNKDSINVLATSDDQHTVVNEHMDVVDSILNRDIAAEFDLSLLLSDTPLPDEDIQNVDNSNNNSLDGIGGSPNWMELPTGEMPKIIDDILEQNSPFFENLDLFEKAHKFNMDKEAYKKDEFKKLIKKKFSNFEQLEAQIINTFCETAKQCKKTSIAQIEKQLIAEFSDYNDTSFEQSNNICNENKVSQSKEVTAEKCYNRCDDQTDTQIREEDLHLHNEQCHKFNLNQIVDKCYEHSDKQIQGSNKTINQCQKPNNDDSKANQIEDPSISQYFGPYYEQSENSLKDRDGLGIDKSHDEVLNDINIVELRKKQYDKESNEQTYQSSGGKPIKMEESTPKSKIHNQRTLDSNIKKINNQLSEGCNEKRIDEINNVSNEEHTAGTENLGELNVGQLKRAIFEQCYDPECRNECKNQKHNSNTELHKKDVQRHEKQTNFTSCHPDIEQWKGRYDLLYKQQCNQSSIDNFKNQLNDEPFDPTIKQVKSKCFFESQKLSCDEKCVTKYKKIAIGHIPGKYLELRWKESEGKSNRSSQEGCKRKHEELGLDQRKILCRESTNNFSQQIMAECPECGYTTDDNDLMNYKSDVDLRITKPLSLINKDMLISLRDIETENNGNNNRVALESVYAMELAYVTAIQALERKLKQKIAISEYRQKKVNNLSKINNTLIKANIILKGFHKNKM